MTVKTRTLLIIGFNLILVGFVCLIIYEEYMRVGKFQWVDPEAIEDNEELYLTPIFIVLALFGIASTLYETHNLIRISTKTKIGKIIKSLFRWVSLIYGAFLIFISAISLFMTLGSIKSNYYDIEFAIIISILLLTSLITATICGLIFYNDLKNYS